MKCPKCAESFTGVPDEQGFYVCPKCGAKLRSKTSSGSTNAVPAAPPSAAPAASAAPALDPGATLPPGTPRKPVARPGEPPATLEAVLAEVRVVRRSQEQVLALLRARPPQSAAPAAEAGFPDEGDEGSAGALGPAASVHVRRRKTVLLVDDQEESRKAALAALETAQVPTRAVSDGNACLAAIAAEKPDVMVMELDIGGSMAGKDVINMIKATMEWVDIPIVLYTRLPIESQKEARTIHGADELVLKGDGSADTLVARVIAIFRRG